MDGELTAYGCWIEGRVVECGSRYPVVNPSTGTTFAYAGTAGEELVETALISAQRNFQQWRSVPTRQRTAVLHRIADLIRGHQAELTSILIDEVGKPAGAAMAEISTTARLFDFFAEEALRLEGKIPLLGYPKEHVIITREPVGVTVAITPFNYPLSTLAVKLAPALAVGCTMVAKPDEHTPLSTLRLAELTAAAGLPDGVFNVLTGSGETTGQLLVNHPIPRLVAFTGSTEVGKKIQAASAKWVRKVVSELGGHCAAIICADAPWKEHVRQIVHQSFRNCGQYCYRISRIYVAEETREDFLREFLKITQSLQIGHAADPKTEIGPLNNAEALERIMNQVETAKRQGAHVETGGSVLLRETGGFYYSPTVLTNVRPEMEISKEEIFGPVVIVSSFSDANDAIEAANDTPYGLAAYLFTKDLGRAWEWAGQLETGSVWINQIHPAYPEAPFGGMKESGLGRERSRFGMEEYTELKTIYFSY